MAVTNIISSQGPDIFEDLDLASISEQIIAINEKNISKETISGFGMKAKTELFVDLLRTALFPNIYDTQVVHDHHYVRVAQQKLAQALILLDCMISELLVNSCELQARSTSECCRCKTKARQKAVAFMNELPHIAELLKTDIAAAYDGDPAATSHEEILLAYPGFEAISVHRLAHVIYTLKIPMLARVMSELAHNKTGIDIHPGATIGERFFIDHGTGVVIGETCTIGKNVKIYQGVTLGARSFDLDENGNPVKGIKRHPDVEDNVTIYAGATILGGDTRIGHGSVIGGNVWLTHSVPPDSIVTNAAPSPHIRTEENGQSR